MPRKVKETTLPNVKHPKTTLEKINQYKQCGDYVNALTQLDKLLKKNRKEPFLYIEKGKVLYFMGRFDESIHQFELANKIRPNHEAYYCMGNVYKALQQHSNTIKSFRKALDLKETLEALANLGSTYLEIGETENALKYLNRAYVKSPHNKIILCSLSALFASTENNDKALEFAKKAYQLDNNFCDALLLLGSLHHLNSQFDQSLEYYKKAWAIQPGDPKTAGTIADLLEKRGEVEEAEKYLQPFIMKNDQTPVIGKAYASILSSRGENEKATKYLEQIIATNKGDIHDIIDLHYMLGRIYDKSHDYKNAFMHYDKANQLSESFYDEYLRKYKKDVFNQRVNNLLKSNHNKLAVNTSPTQHQKKMIFILGMFRTGTSLLEHVLSVHSRIHGAGELPGTLHITHILEKRYEQTYPDFLAHIPATELPELLSIYNNEIDNIPAEVDYIIDKTPDNFLYIGLIKLLFPDAIILHTIRNPVDTCLSMYFQRFAPGSTSFTCNLKNMAKYYHQYQDIMKYWKNIYGDSIHDIYYADLVTDAENTITKILKICGLNIEEACFNHQSVKRDINTPSYHQVRKPMYASSLERWKNYEPYITELIKAFENHQVSNE